MKFIAEKNVGMQKKKATRLTTKNHLNLIFGNVNMN